jgi:phosphatidylserine decarboxylase
MDKFSRPDPPSQTAFPVASAGYPFILVAAFTTAILALLGFTALTLIGLVVTFCICGFFRDPDRVTPVDKGVVVSPADGKIIAADLVDNSPLSDGEFMKISIFMSVFNVHVNRVPYNGQVKEIDYYPGKFFSANLDKASEQNEHNAVSIEMETGQPLCVVQIAGLIARRIICYIKPGDQVIRGQRFGLICFGSRLDVYLPADLKLKAAVGDKVKAGTSILGELNIE